MSISDKPVLVLCGGLGTRLRSVVPDLPKVLVPINGVPFLDLLLAYIQTEGVTQIYLSLGYKSEMVLSHLLEKRAYFQSLGLTIKTYVEPEPLGTAGAVRFALQKMRELPKQLIVMNGDTFIDADLKSLIKQTAQQKNKMTMVAVEVEDCSRFGALKVEEGMVKGFFEKGESHLPGIVNGGVYCFGVSLLQSLSRSTVTSLETEVFPELVKRRAISLKVHRGAFLDYGTPEGLSLAKQCASNFSKFKSDTGTFAG